MEWLHVKQWDTMCYRSFSGLEKLAKAGWRDVWENCGNVMLKRGV